MKAEKRQRLYVTIIRNLCDKNKRTVCRALRTLVTIYDGKDCGHFIQIGGNLAVIQAMESRNDARVQRSGCMAIISLSQNKQLRDKIIEDGGIGTITAGMEEFAHNKSVQMCSCSNMSCRHPQWMCCSVRFRKTWRAMPPGGAHPRVKDR